jgi:ParB-like chromosome segregation protein Spo0J
MKVISLPISEINVGTRRREDFGDIEGLAASIVKYGLFHPAIVDDKNNLVAGERRLVACISLGWTEIPCRLFRDLSEDERLEIELEENLQRKDLTPFEQSKNLVQISQVAEKIIQSEFSGISRNNSEAKPGRPPKPVSEDKVAERIGVDRKTVSNAKQHVKAVETYPELKDSPQATAISTAKTLDSLPPQRREQARSNISQIRKAPLARPSKHSPNSPIQEWIRDVKSKGGALSFYGKFNDTQKFEFLDELRNCQADLETYIAELQDYFDEQSAVSNF